MSNKYVMLECNRLRANLNYKNIDEAEDDFKNEWVNNVNSYGIVVNPGDIITCESSAINTVGASDQTIEFLAKPNKNGFQDNKCNITFSYYLNDTGVYGAKLPLTNTIVGMGAAKVGGPPVLTFLGYNDPNTDSNGQLLRNRMYGSPFFENPGSYSITQDPPSTDQYENEPIFPLKNLVYRYELSKVSADIGKGYRINGVYQANPVAPGTGTLMTIKVLDITSEGANTGIPTKIQMIDPGGSYTSGEVVQMNVAADGGSNPTTVQKVKLVSYLNVNFKTRNTYGATGKRYYFTGVEYTGPNMTSFIGIPESGSLTNMDDLDDPAIKRTTSVGLEVPEGLNTPDNMASILTNQLHKGEKLLAGKGYRFMDYGEYFVKTQDINDNPTILRPPVVQTPTYTPMAVNMAYKVSNINIEPKTFVGARRSYYQNVGYLDIDKLIGLERFNKFYYGLKHDDPQNQICSGTELLEDAGDFGNQEVGNLGLIASLLMDLPLSVPGNITQSVIKYPKNGIILTNIFFEEEQIRQIAEGFRVCEQYFDPLNETFNIDNAPDSAYAVNLDLGRYNDETSQGYSLNDGQTAGTKAIGQRKRFMTPYERDRNQGDIKPDVFVDDGTGSNNQYPCRGTIPFRQFIYDDNILINDGQQMSQLVVRSRFDPTLYYNKEDYEDVPGNIFHDFYQIISTQKDPADPTNHKYGNTDSIDLQFNNQYTDPLINKTYKTDDLIKIAEKYNVAAIPIFPPSDGGEGGLWKLHGGRPFIGFFSKFQLGDDNPINSSNLAGEDFVIDARNCKYGMPIGYDPAAVRNPQMLFYNTNYADPTSLDDPNNTYNTIAYLGAVNPSFNFDPALSRFNIEGLNTPMTIGNGLPTNNQFDLDATGNPEQQCININTAGQITDVDSYGGYDNRNGNTNGPRRVSILNEFVDQTSDRIIDSYSGLSIENIVLYDKDQNGIILSGNGLFAGAYNNLNNLPAGTQTKYSGDVLDGTLLGKMGFKINQLLPKYGSIYADYNDPLVFLQNNQAVQYQDIFLNTQKPMTTGAVVNSAEYQPSSTNQQDMPLYGLGTNMGLTSRPAVEQGTLTAQDLPTKLDYPYLLIYSSIISGGTDTEYFGGFDGKSHLPCVGYITRNYNQGDFFYSLEQSFNYTATKSYTLTEVKTEIRLPDGSRPKLQPHNSVIYKITKPMALPPELPLPQPETVDTNRQKKENTTKKRN